VCAVGAGDKVFGLVPSASVVAQEAVANAIVRELLMRKASPRRTSCWRLSAPSEQPQRPHAVN
jgi:hypothetical protein